MGLHESERAVGEQCVVAILGDEFALAGILAGSRRIRRTIGLAVTACG